MLFLLPILLWLVNQLGDALHFVRMKCSSLHSFSPIDSTFCTSWIYILASGALGRPMIGHSRPRGGPTASSLQDWSVHLPAS